MADGTINFDTKVDTRPIKEQLKSVQSEIKDLNKDLANLDKEHKVRIKYVQDNSEKYEQLKALYGDSKVTNPSDASFINQYEQILDETIRIEDEQAVVNGQLDNANDKLNEIKNTTSEIGGSGGGFIDNIKSKLSGVMATLGKVKDKIKDSFSGSDKDTNGSSLVTSMIKSLTSIGTLMKFRIKRMIVNALMSAFSSGFESLTSSNSAIKGQLNELSSSFTQLGANIMSAFAPVLSFVLPIINTIISALNNAISVVQKFFAVLGGGNSIQRATKNNKAYSDSAGSVAKSNDKATASFDELNQLNNTQSSGGGSSSGTDVSGFTTETFELSDTMERIQAIGNNIAQIFSNIKDRIVEAWESNGNGERIMQSLANIGETLLSTIERIVEATLQWSATIDFVPLFESLASVLEVIDPLIANLSNMLVWFYESVILPLATFFIEQLIPALVNLLVPVISTINSIISAISPILSELWTNVIQPLGEYLGSTLIETLNFVSETIGLNQEDITQVFALLTQIISWLLATLAPVVRSVISIISSAIKTFFTAFSGIISSIRQVLSGIITFITGVFSGNWSQAWDGIKEVFKGVFNGIVTIAENAINFIVDCLNSISFDVPDWVPLIGGKHMGFDISHVSLPRLATGTIVPPNNGEFLAMLGDNKNETEVVSPLSTMKQALLEALGEQQQNITIKFDGNLRQLARVLEPVIEEEKNRKGVSLAVGV